MSLRQYARHRGVQLFTIQAAIKSGRISTIADESGRGWIDPEIADKQFAENTDPSKQNRKPDLGDPILRRLHGCQDPETPAPPEEIGGFQKSKARTQLYQAKLKRLEYLKELGKLVDAEKVRSEAFKIGKATKEAVLGVSDKIAPILAATSDQKEVRRILFEELNKALEAAAREGKREESS